MKIPKSPLHLLTTHIIFDTLVQFPNSFNLCENVLTKNYHTKIPKQYTVSAWRCSVGQHSIGHIIHNIHIHYLLRLRCHNSNVLFLTHAWHTINRWNLKWQRNDILTHRADIVSHVPWELLTFKIQIQEKHTNVWVWPWVIS